jgi:hypothetical protein
MIWPDSSSTRLFSSTRGVRKGYSLFGEDGLRGRKTISMRPEAFDAEEFNADGLLQVRNNAMGGRTY